MPQTIEHGATEHPTETPTHTDSVEHPYTTVDMTRAGTSFRALHDQVIARQSRIEITRPGSDDACILISKRELESLEQAIAILAHTEYFQQLCRSLQDLLQSAGMVYSGANEPLVQSGANEG